MLVARQAGVVRLPRLRLPCTLRTVVLTMRLLDRYLLRELLIPLGYCLVGMLVFWLSFELINEMGELQSRHLTAGEITRYCLHRAPAYLMIELPIALLLALLYALTQHSRHHELVAIRAAGVSLWRIAVPYLGVGLVLSLAMLALNEFLIPDSAERAEAILSRQRDADARAWRQNLNFRDTQSDRTWDIRQYNLDTSEMIGPHVQWRRSDGGREELIAERARWEDGAWVFHDVTHFTFPPGADALGESSQTNRWVARDFPETPVHIRNEVKISRLLGSFKKSRQVQLSLSEIRTYRELHRQLPKRFDNLLSTWFHDRLAAPWTPLVVVLVAIPAGAGSGRRNMLVGVATTIFMCFICFAFKEVSLAFGSGGYLPPWLAAWLPNALFAVAGLWLIHRVR